MSAERLIPDGAGGSGVAASWPVTHEDRPRSWLVFLLLVLFTLLLGFMLFLYQAPGNGSSDDHGYLRTARMIFESQSLSFEPHHPLEFAGTMMVIAPNGRLYAKYPFGFPLLAAIGRVFYGPEGMYIVNPLCTVLAGFVSFFFFQRVLGNFASLMGAVLLACNPNTLFWANLPMSHASTLLCVVVGFWGLLRWYQTGSWWSGMIGGFALGYATTIRYTEFLLALPVAFAAVSRINFNPRRWKQALPPLIGWAIPIAALAIVCWHAYGKPWLTGYSLCKEQTGFGWQFFIGTDSSVAVSQQGNWETLLHQMNHTGLFLLWPAGLAGLFAMFWLSWRLAGILCLWVLPPTVLYLFYYWAPAGEVGFGYLRFFMSVFPALILTALWVIDRAIQPHRHAAALAIGALTGLSTCFNVAQALPTLSNFQTSHVAVVSVIAAAQRVYPPCPQKPNVLLADDATCGYLDALGGYELYATNLFQSPNLGMYLRAAGMDGNARSLQADDPNWLQRARAELYVRILGEETSPGVWKQKSSRELDALRMQVIDGALSRGLRVAMLLHGKVEMTVGEIRPDLRVVKLGSWRDPPRFHAAPAGGLLTRWAMGLDPTPPLPRTPGRIKPATWTLYEIVKLPQGSADAK